jgi:hypothetical protein
MKVIETKYNGVAYRSRLEARWAAMFEAMGWNYTYEPEGFEWNDKVYLPDFWIDDWSAFVAIKPMSNDKAIQKGLKQDLLRQCDMIACGVKHYTIEGAPIAGKYRIYVGEEAVPCLLADCRRCDGTNYVGEDIWGNITKCCDTDKAPSPDCSPRIERAFEAAMRERFGERSARYTF